MSSDLPEGWNLVPLSDLIQVHHGFAFKGGWFRENPPGDILLTPGNFAVGGGFSRKKLKYYVGPADEEYVLPEGTLLITMTDLSKAADTLGYPAIVPPAPDGSRFLHNQRLGKVEIVAPERVDQEFLYFAMRSNRYRRQILASASGTTVKHTSPSRIGEAVIPTPPLEEQRRIAWILGSLDDKIENNRRIAKTLEEIAATLFKARFVDFVGHDDLVESEFGPIPRGWRVGHLADIASITMGQSPPSSTYTDDSGSGPVMVQGKGSFGTRFPKREVFCAAPTRLAEAGDLLITVRAPVGEINVCRETTCLGRGVAGISSKHIGFVEFALREERQRWRAHEGGTIYPSVNKRQVEHFPVVIPPVDIMDEFEETAAAVGAKLVSLHKESDLLAAIRDTLLPKLISGEIRVGEAEKVVEEHA